MKIVVNEKEVQNSICFIIVGLCIFGLGIIVIGGEKLSWVSGVGLVLMGFGIGANALLRMLKVEERESTDEIHPS